MIPTRLLFIRLSMLIATYVFIFFLVLSTSFPAVMDDLLSCD